MIINVPRRLGRPPKPKLPNLIELFPESKLWTKGAAGRDRDGDATNDYDQALCFCLAGRLEQKFGVKGLSGPIPDAIATAIKEIYPSRLPIGPVESKVVPKTLGVILKFNDHPATTFTDVQNVLRLAQEKLRFPKEDK